ncbi:hypothetical protein PEC301875_24960 [Pectobacterium carotovorum subsp. carotovorum]|nr:hypothetical protein PEC301875_24960 [Pectobacterium carotovorum subsp. carotovorum]
MVLSREIIHGSLEVRNGVIHHISDRPSRHPGALDGEQAWLLPVLVELHTDNLDKCFTPRPGVNWRVHAAALKKGGEPTCCSSNGMRHK